MGISIMNRLSIFVSTFAFAIAGILGFAAVEPANAVSCSNSSLASTFGRYSKEMGAGAATMKKLENKFDKLCEYGRRTGTPLFDRQLKEQAEISRACSDDPIVRAIVMSNRVTAAGYKQEIGTYCEYADALARSPQSAADYVVRGRALAEKKDIDRAISDFSEAIKLDPKLATAYYNRAGVLHNDKKDTKAAVADIFEAVRLDPKNGGSSYFASGNSDRRIADNVAIASDAISKTPDFGNGYETRASMYLAMGETDLAMKDAAKAISLYANDTSALNDRALGYLNKGNPSAAISDLDEAILLKPKSAALYQNRGNAYLQNGDLKSALADLDEAIRLDPKQQPAYAYRGQVHEKMGQRDKAIADYTSALFKNEDWFNTLGLKAYLTAANRLQALMNGEQVAK